MFNEIDEVRGMKAFLIVLLMMVLFLGGLLVAAGNDWGKIGVAIGLIGLVLVDKKLVFGD
jgi:hypothetical protein